jgi:uncharacterized membrane protein
MEYRDDTKEEPHMSNQPYSSDPRNQPYDQPTVPDNQAPYAGQAYRPAEAVRSSDAGGAHAQSQYENYVDGAGNRVESREEVYEDKNQSRANMRYWITTVTYFVLGVLEVILLLRLLFRLLGANQGNAFITFLYDLSHIFVVGFNGIFNDQALGTRSVFELSTVIAMIVYALLAWGIVSLGRVIFAPVLTGHQSTMTTRRSRY